MCSLPTVVICVWLFVCFRKWDLASLCVKVGRRWRRGNPAFMKHKHTHTLAVWNPYWINQKAPAKIKTPPHSHPNLMCMWMYTTEKTQIQTVLPHFSASPSAPHKEQRLLTNTPDSGSIKVKGLSAVIGQLPNYHHYIPGNICILLFYTYPIQSFGSCGLGNIMKISLRSPLIHHWWSIILKNT